MSALMSLPEFQKKQAQRLLDNFCSELAADLQQPRRVRYLLEGRQANLFELHPTAGRLPLAQLRYSPELNQWTLHFQNGERWQLYMNVNPTLDLSKLLTALKQDPMNHFWHH